MNIEPCPFCGSDSVSVQEGLTYRLFMAVCDECGARGPEVRGTRDEVAGVDNALAIEAWNNRKVPV